MADGVPPTQSPADDPASPPRGDGAGQPPPPLSSIRVKGPGAKGLNKPAILIAAGGGLALVLVLASGGFSGSSSKKPAEVKPMMSDPARPEMAQGAVRGLPSTYEDVAAQEASIRPAQPPLLGPPLPGDVAAFAPNEARYQSEPGWSGGSDGQAGAPEPDLAEQEAHLADRSAIFFQVKQTEPTAAAAAAASPAPQSPLTTLARAPDDQQVAPSAGPSVRALHPGAVIPASLITAINSEAPGPVIAQVTQAIYDSATGRTLLIPQGARLIGDYKSSARYGQSRVAILWSRLIMPNGGEIALDEAAVDPSGAAGVRGKVDNHWGEVFGAAALGTLINIGVATTEDQPSIGLTYSGVGISNYDPVQDALRDGVQRSAAIVTNRVVDRSLAIPPTIRVEAGTRISVISTRRIEL
jgi:type IV secretion system protein TrbI